MPHCLSIWGWSSVPMEESKVHVSLRLPPGLRRLRMGVYCWQWWNPLFKYFTIASYLCWSLGDGTQMWSNDLRWCRMIWPLGIISPMSIAFFNHNLWFFSSSSLRLFGLSFLALPCTSLGRSNQRVFNHETKATHLILHHVYPWPTQERVHIHINTRTLTFLLFLSFLCWHCWVDLKLHWPCWLAFLDHGHGCWQALLKVYKIKAPEVARHGLFDLFHSLLGVHVVSFCSHLNNPKPRVPTLKKGFTSVYYRHLSLHSSFLRPKGCYIHSKTWLVCLLLFFPLLVSGVCVSVSCSFHLTMRFCITIVKRE